MLEGSILTGNCDKMQHKRKHTRPIVVILVVGGFIAVGVSMLLTKEISAPQQAIEKELDAKQFVGD